MLRALHPLVGALRSLTTLNVAFNRLQSLPAEVSRLTKLQVSTVPWSRCLVIVYVCVYVCVFQYILYSLDSTDHVIHSLPSQTRHNTDFGSSF